MFDATKRWIDRMFGNSESFIPKVQAEVPAPYIEPNKLVKKVTSGYRNWVNQRIFRPVIRGGVATQADGTRYQVRDDGWRRLSNVIQKSV